MKKNNSTMRLKFLGILLSQLFILALSAQKPDTFQFLTIHDVFENINNSKDFNNIINPINNITTFLICLLFILKFFSIIIYSLFYFFINCCIY